MTEGDQLQYFIDNQTIPKVKIAEALGMSRQNLFQMFKSNMLEPETKKKFENFFGETIFTKEAMDNIGKQNFEKIATARQAYSQKKRHNYRIFAGANKAPERN